MDWKGQPQYKYHNCPVYMARNVRQNHRTAVTKGLKCSVDVCNSATAVAQDYLILSTTVIESNR